MKWGSDLRSIGESNFSNEFNTQDVVVPAHPSRPDNFGMGFALTIPGVAAGVVIGVVAFLMFYEASMLVAIVSALLAVTASTACFGALGKRLEVRARQRSAHGLQDPSSVERARQMVEAKARGDFDGFGGGASGA